MATITIKIDSDELAREVLIHLGYLPGEDDDVPDLISVEDEETPVEETKEPEPPKAPVTAVKSREAPWSVSSRDAFVEQMLKKLLVDEGLMEAEPVVPTVPEPLDEGFGTPLGKTGVEPFETVKPGVVQNPELWQRHYEQRFSEPGVDEAVATQEAKLKREEKEQKQIQLRARMQKVKDTNTVEEYKAELKRLMHSEDKAIKEVADDLLGDMDPDYIKYIEEKEPISYEDYLRYE